MRHRSDRPVVQVLWHSTDGRTWEQCPVYRGAPLSTLLIPPDKEWTDGYGNRYRSNCPEDAA